ncbi:MAG: proline dehydrogenase family protein, partial [Acidobacteriia bacterium]|nr:proline dehydrogenase family protein [Terriglobia bacterium]
MLRKALLFLARQQWLRGWIQNSRLTRPLVRRFVAGTTLDEAMQVCLRLEREGTFCTLDHLGENVSSSKEAESSLQFALNAIARFPCGRAPATVSIKLTQFGLDISESLCRQLMIEVAAAAEAAGTGIEIDMESSAYVDRTLAMVRHLHGKTGNVRAVIQAYLYRSQSDIKALCSEAIPVRLCKGAYLEPPSIAFQEKSKVDRNYCLLMNFLLEHGRVPALATHDDAILKQAVLRIRQLDLDRHSYEFQMLYGVRRRLQNMLVSGGHPLRLYVPYGVAWYPYFMRRLAERPA